MHYVDYLLHEHNFKYFWEDTEIYRRGFEEYKLFSSIMHSFWAAR